MKFKKSLLIICLVICLFAVASVSASDADDTTMSLEDKGEIELSHESDMESVDNNLKTSEEQEIVKQTDNEEIMGETDAGTFTALKNKIANAQSGSTVYLENNYSCEDSWTQKDGIFISKSITIDGQGFTIDAKHKTRIFNVTAPNVIIKNIRFINAQAEMRSGAVEIYADGCTVSGCSFINCAAVPESSGVITGAIGGAIGWCFGKDGDLHDCVFINNTAGMGSAVIWYFSDYGTIHDCIFIDNAASEPFSSVGFDHPSVVCNWYGNTAENYKSSPADNTDKWLFLNATVNPNSIIITETADVIFKLYLYDSKSKNITEHTTLAEADLTLNSNGKLNKNVTGLYEKVTFTPTSPGTGSITATIGNVAYTTTVKVADGTTFADLNYLINNSTNDTITLDKDYAYNPDFDSAFIEGIQITRPVTINGNGRTLDGKGKSCIFWVKSDNVTINNVNFVNGKAEDGGAIYWGGDNGVVSGSSFIGNRAINLYGGAIFWVGSDGTVSGSIFTDNAVESGYGGAIYWRGPRGAVSGSSFAGNNASNYGGAIYWSGDNGAVSGSSFIGNNAINKGGAIYWVAANGNISDSIFINNAANESATVYGANSVRVDYCWFGNTAENYNASLAGVDTDNWLFLNATINPNPILITKTADIIFKLYSYNSTSKDTTDYTSLADVNLTLSPNGKLDKNVTGLYDIVTYTPTSLETDSITATIENVVYTITFTVNKENSTLTINDNVTFDYNSAGSTIVSFTNARGVVANVVDHHEAIVKVEGNTITVSNLAAGNYTLNVTTIVNENYNPVTKTASITVNKLSTAIVLANETLDLKVNAMGTISVNLTPAGAGNLAYVSSDESVIRIINGVYFAQGKGTAIITVSFAGNENYTAAENRTITVTVTLSDASVSVKNATLNLKVGDRFDLNATSVPDYLNIEYVSSNPSVVSVTDYGIVTAVGEGTAVITVTVGNNETYALNSTNVTVTVTRIASQITSSAITTVYNVNKYLTVTLKDDKGNPISGASITVVLNGAKTYTTDKNGQIKINVAKLVPKTYTAKITFNGDDIYGKSAKNVKVVVKKAKAKITAKKKTFKKSKKVKKYAITLKSGKKPIKKVKVTIKIGKKTFKAKTNAKGKATFKIKKSTKKGKYKAVVKFKGNKYYNKATKKVKITIK